MGFGYETLKELNPRIIMVNVSAYGQFGPYKDNIGYDPIGQTMSGITMVTGEEGMPPIRTGVPIIDRITALARGHRRRWRRCTSGRFRARGSPWTSAWRTPATP